MRSEEVDPGATHPVEFLGPLSSFLTLTNRCPTS